MGKEESCNFAPAFGNETDAGGCPAAGQAGAQMPLRAITGGVAGRFRVLKIFSPENLVGKKKRRNFAGLSGNGRCTASEGPKIEH